MAKLLTEGQIKGLTKHYNNSEFYSDISINDRLQLIIGFCVKRFNTNYAEAKKIVKASKIQDRLI